MLEYFDIGKIVNTHGIKGEVKIIPLTDEPSRFELLDTVIIENQGKTLHYHIEKIKYFKKFVIIKFKEVVDMNNAECLKGSFIKIPREQAIPLDENEYYINDLIGLIVITIDDKKLGKLKDVLITGGNDVYIIENEEKNEILIPAIKECVKEINVNKGIMIVELMEGLIDE